jgi:FMN phosphatase YigB (HAD superfamily)
MDALTGSVVEGVIRAPAGGFGLPALWHGQPADRGLLSSIGTLLIDIDGTITRPKQGKGDVSTGSLLEVLRIAGVRLAGLAPEEVQARMEKVQRENRWWHLSDFIVALDLNPKVFWEFAYQTEREYMEATGPEIGAALRRLRDAGFLLYVTSNNPSSGILHKLRLAGLGHIHGCELFSQLLGVAELHAMKWEPHYWKKVLAHIGMDANEVAVIGDNPRDDWEVPHSIGIGCGFLIDRNQDQSAQDEAGLYHVQNFQQITEKLLSARRPAAAAGR